MEKDFLKNITITPFSPKTENQKLFLTALKPKNKEKERLVIGEGFAGTGKTFLAVGAALERIKNKEFKKLVVVRPKTEIRSQSLGFTPGSKQEKMLELVSHIVSYVCYFTRKSHAEVSQWMERGNMIEVEAVEYIQGQTYSDSIIIIDECQSLSRPILKMIVTRIGENSTMVLLGSTDQKNFSDSMSKVNICPFEEYINMVKRDRNSMEHIVQFDINDVVRSKLAKANIYRFMREPGW
jgi:phosphate starvation-inducible PhoH-like protein